MGELSKWQIGLIAGAGVIIIGLAISLSLILTQRGPGPTQLKLRETTKETPIVTPPVPQIAEEEIRFQGRYLRPGVEEGQYYFYVDEILAGPTPCQKDGLLVVIEPAHGQRYFLRTGDQLEVLGSYETTATACRVILRKPEQGIKLLSQPSLAERQPSQPRPEAPTPPSPEIPPPPNPEPITPQPGKQFFFSGGISLLRSLTLIKGSAGLTLGPQLRGLVSAGMGQGEIKKRISRTGEELPVQLQATAIEAALLYQISDKIYAGGSLGVITLSGDYYDLPYPVQASKSFTKTLLTAGLIAGFDLGYTMATGSISIILGGES
jgi:hypothetical protein